MRSIDFWGRCATMRARNSLASHLEAFSTRGDAPHLPSSLHRVIRKPILAGPAMRKAGDQLNTELCYF
jgi:hypothetical protein